VSSAAIERRAVASGPGGSARRADIDGLRALAVLLVVVYHVWFGRVSGGVDVFLLLSAYFLTGWFLRRSEGVGFGALPAFWVRRFGRLVPGAALTIAAVLAWAAAARPPSAWHQLWEQAWASLLYVQNRALTAEAVDYYARTEAFSSPLQHFWSLSVQGQVFLLWPLLIVAVIVAARRLRLPVRHALTALFAVVFAASFGYSIWLTGVDQQVAYFSLPARVWEFALGSLAALILPSLRISAPAAAFLGWAGLAALVACGAVLDVGAGFPGVAALWPTLAAVAVIAAGQTAQPARVTRLLGSGWLVAVGRIAYPLYLVHWPILIAVMVALDTTSIGLVAGAGVIAASLAAAWFLDRVVEGPRRRRLAVSATRGARAIVAWALVAALPLGGWQLAEGVRAAGIDASANPGAAVLMPWVGARVEDDTPLVPAGTALDAEWVSLAEPCGADQGVAGTVLEATCTQSIAAQPAGTVLVVGDSHAEQWMGALLPVLEEEQWSVLALLKGGCSLGPDEDSEPDCVRWREEAAEFAVEHPVDLVVMVGTRAAVDTPQERVPRGLETIVARVAESDSQVLLVRDNPRFSFDMFACLEERGDDGCAQPASSHLAAENPAAGMAEHPRVHSIDLSAYLCPDGSCRAAIGNVAVYMDDNHLTGSYARTLAPAVRAALQALPGVPLG
jgi:peptidoglycan/LPS O-acetylase OafA/YrhL